MLLESYINTDHDTDGTIESSETQEITETEFESVRNFLYPGANNDLGVEKTKRKTAVSDFITSLQGNESLRKNLRVGAWNYLKANVGTWNENKPLNNTTVEMIHFLLYLAGIEYTGGPKGGSFTKKDGALLDEMRKDINDGGKLIFNDSRDFLSSSLSKLRVLLDSEDVPEGVDDETADDSNNGGNNGGGGDVVPGPADDTEEPTDDTEEPTDDTEEPTDDTEEPTDDLSNNIEDLHETNLIEMIKKHITIKGSKPVSVSSLQKVEGKDNIYTATIDGFEDIKIKYVDNGDGDELKDQGDMLQVQPCVVTKRLAKFHLTSSPGTFDQNNRNAVNIDLISLDPAKTKTHLQNMLGGKNSPYTVESVGTDGKFTLIYTNSTVMTNSQDKIEGYQISSDTYGLEVDPNGWKQQEGALEHEDNGGDLSLKEIYHIDESHKIIYYMREHEGSLQVVNNLYRRSGTDNVPLYEEYAILDNNNEEITKIKNSISFDFHYEKPTNGYINTGHKKAFDPDNVVFDGDKKYHILVTHNGTSLKIPFVYKGSDNSIGDMKFGDSKDISGSMKYKDNYIIMDGLIYEVLLPSDQTQRIAIRFDQVQTTEYIEHKTKVNFDSGPLGKTEMVKDKTTINPSNTSEYLSFMMQYPGVSLGKMVYQNNGTYVRKLLFGVGDSSKNYLKTKIGEILYDQQGNIKEITTIKKGPGETDNIVSRATNNNMQEPLSFAFKEKQLNLVPRWDTKTEGETPVVSGITLQSFVKNGNNPNLKENRKDVDTFKLRAERDKLSIGKFLQKGFCLTATNMKILNIPTYDNTSSEYENMTNIYEYMEQNIIGPNGDGVFEWTVGDTTIFIKVDDGGDNKTKNNKIVMCKNKQGDPIDANNLPVVKADKNGKDVYYELSFVDNSNPNDYIHTLPNFTEVKDYEELPEFTIEYKEKDLLCGSAVSLDREKRGNQYIYSYGGRSLFGINNTKVNGSWTQTVAPAYGTSSPFTTYIDIVLQSGDYSHGNATYEDIFDAITPPETKRPLANMLGLDTQTYKNVITKYMNGVSLEDVYRVPVKLESGRIFYQPSKITVNKDKVEIIAIQDVKDNLTEAKEMLEKATRMVDIVYEGSVGNVTFQNTKKNVVQKILDNNKKVKGDVDGYKLKYPSGEQELTISFDKNGNPTKASPDVITINGLTYEIGFEEGTNHAWQITLNEQ